MREGSHQACCLVSKDGFLHLADPRTGGPNTVRARPPTIVSFDQSAAPFSDAGAAAPAHLGIEQVVERGEPGALRLANRLGGREVARGPGQLYRPPTPPPNRCMQRLHQLLGTDRHEANAGRRHTGRPVPARVSA